ncbi:hypothetical protein PR001_g477 [Phytophthora rubi]|uniref:Peptidase A2 domain-containing protein n=1 Tax=Phytophthora rubi TaxID=129364 RepID=A0A6A3P3B5_9STRA|nr:hypothetical protein PR001_g477 [Phytophthora rubi]
MLLDCGTTTIYVSERWVEEHRLQTTKFSNKSMRVKLGDNQIAEVELDVLPMEILVSGLNDVYKCVAVVYAILDESTASLEYRSSRTGSRRLTGGVDESKEQ